MINPSEPLATGLGRAVEAPAAGSRTLVSIIIPVFNGAATIRPLVTQLHEELGACCRMEIMLINDCSPDDNSEEVCRELALAHPETVRFVNLSRNFGEHNAVMAGLVHCNGDVAVIIDDDFQNPPREVIKLVDKLSEGYDVVFSSYGMKKHHWFRNLGSRFHNSVASIMLKKSRSLYLSSFKAINRFVIDEITTYQGPYPYIDGLILRITSNFATQQVEHESRKEGSSGYTSAKLVGLWLNMFTNFSILPLRVASIAGFVIAAIGFVLALLVVIERLRTPELPLGWAFTTCILLTVSGIQLIALGLIGEYLGRLFLKDNGSPQFVVRDTMNCGERKSKTTALGPPFRNE